MAALIQRNHVKSVPDHQRREIPRVGLLREAVQEKEGWQVLIAPVQVMETVIPSRYKSFLRWGNRAFWDPQSRRSGSVNQVQAELAIGIIRDR